MKSPLPYVEPCRQFALLDVALHRARGEHGPPGGDQPATAAGLSAISTNNTSPNNGCRLSRRPETRRRSSKLHPKATGAAVTEFLVFQPDNPNSIVQCICQARENARMVRDQITIELWEELNRLYLFITSREARQVWKQSPSDFFSEIKAASMHLTGIAYATLLQNEGWWFSQAGRFLERADKTSRILDVRHQSLPPKGHARRHRPGRGAGVVGHPAFLQRLGRLQIAHRRGCSSRSGDRIPCVERGFPAFHSLLRDAVEHGAAKNFRRA